MIYMDTSALTKLLIAEPETPELRTWLIAQGGMGEYAATSAIGRIELMRVVARYGESGQSERARYLLDGLDILPLTERVLALAETVGPPSLCTLDAIHLATFVLARRRLEGLEMLTVDARLQEAVTGVR